jgi:hypothetical protein
MASRTVEHISLLLEVCAFFLVTIELYGERRLNEGALLIRTVLQRGRTRFAKYIEFWFGLGFVLFTILIVFGMFLPDRPNYGGWNAWSIILIGLVGLFVLICSALAIVLLVWSSAVFGTFLLARLRLRGIMLLVGALLFVVAKAMIW